MQVAFTATEPVWVSVRSDGTRAYSGTLEGRQSREFGASKKMTVLIGNAGALEVSLNGKPVGPIGPVAPGFEVRYQGGKGTLPGDQSFSATKIDLGGMNYLFTLNIRF